MSNLSRLSTLWIALYWYFYMCMFVYRCGDGGRDLIYGFNTFSFQLIGIGRCLTLIFFFFTGLYATYPENIICKATHTA